jgi:hypothetical protein
MEINEQLELTLLELQQAMTEVRGQIRELKAELIGLEVTFLKMFPVKTGDIVPYHDEDWIVLKVEVREVRQKVRGFIHLVKPTKAGGIPGNRVDGNHVITINDVGKPAPVYDPNRKIEL